ncbi:sensor histidine kinase [Mucilaginibacter gossypii]|uniref:Histidine kinase n=1 Tax=Mucilaginibacter gossypii TaxID=551996 RepID=A0A1G8BPB5_9SPHI|nr:histidine kinase [Mucilaginibacter gossypii]SDH34430.1 Histidine kinase [Mucilaginibacter gossypii]
MGESTSVRIDLQQRLSVSLVGVFFSLFLYYPLVYFILPLLRHKKWLSALFFFLLYYLAAVLLRDYHIKLVVGFYNLKNTWVIGGDFWERLRSSRFNLTILTEILFSSIPSMLQVIYIPLSIKFIRYAYQSAIRQAWLARENAQLQLSTLKAQINPHFFFNTLNNLQSFIVRNEKAKSVDLLIKLGEFMRSTLYDCNEDFITMSQEISLLRNYIAIELVRFAEKADIRINLADQDPDYQIPPFIFLPFIENTFKYGGALPTNEIDIHVELVNGSEAILLKINNRYHKKTDLIASGGIGLQNVRMRLDHYYKAKHQLLINQADDFFSVELQIDKS